MGSGNRYQDAHEMQCASGIALVTVASGRTRFGGMPRNAIATGAIDSVLPPAQIGRELARLGQHRFLVPATPGVAQSETLPDDDQQFKRTLAMLLVATKIDFSQYKQTTIRRRIGLRLMMLRIESLAEYARRLQNKASS